MPNAKIVTSSSVARSTGADVLGRVIGMSPAPLLPGEAEEDYATVATRMVAGIQPKDYIEEFLTRDLIDLTWEILRLRRAKAGLSRASAGKGVRRILSAIGKTSAYDIAQKWASGDPNTRREVAETLKKADLTVDDAMAEALAEVVDTFERMDRMLASAEVRRNNALREIDRHREALGSAMQRAINEVQDAEFRDVETGEESGGPPS